MRRLVFSLTLLGTTGLVLGSPAVAGSCGYGVPLQHCAPPAPVVNCAPGVVSPNCQVPVKVMSAPAPQHHAVTVHTANPMGHLRSVEYRSAPNVSITRVYGQREMVGLSDFPSKFTNGCHPTSTQYCRQAAPAVAPAPVAMPMVQHRVQHVVRPAPAVDMSKFTPRVYGDNTLTPGIAHIPTSIVDRSYDNAMAVLNSGRTQPQPIVSGGQVPMPSQVSTPVAAPMSFVAPPRIAPMPAPTMGGTRLGSVTQTVSSGGTHWEKVSGPTMFGSTMATQVICKRQSPSVQVKRDVIGVPVSVPVGVPVPAGCTPAPQVHNSGPVLAGGPVSSRYGH